jgi:anthranilate phosphoribosyltransferase
MKIAGVLEKLMRRENLSVEESAEAMAAIMSGDATPAQIAALLIGLTMKGERPAEIVGLAKTMRASAVQLSRTFDNVFDTCGTGGDRAGTFNISSAAALVAAASGLRIAKHGNRSVSSQCGSADVYEALGVNIGADPAVVEESLDKVGIAFFFAPTFHPSMRHAAPVRRELAVRTAFNLLGPLTNPAGTRRQLVGVPHSELTELIARSLMSQLLERGALACQRTSSVWRGHRTGVAQRFWCRRAASTPWPSHEAGKGAATRPQAPGHPGVSRSSPRRA